MMFWGCVWKAIMWVVDFLSRTSQGLYALSTNTAESRFLINKVRVWK